MELCRSHDSNFGVSKSGIDYLKLSKHVSSFSLGIVVRIGRCIALNKRDKEAVVRSCI